MPPIRLGTRWRTYRKHSYCAVQNTLARPLLPTFFIQRWGAKWICESPTFTIFHDVHKKENSKETATWRPHVKELLCANRSTTLSPHVACGIAARRASKNPLQGASRPAFIGSADTCLGVQCQGWQNPPHKPLHYVQGVPVAQIPDINSYHFVAPSDPEVSGKWLEGISNPLPATQTTFLR